MNAEYIYCTVYLIVMNYIQIKMFVKTCDAHLTIEAVVVWSLNFLKIILTLCQLDVIIRTALDTMSTERR